MAVSKRLRFEVLRRDNHACRYCGRAAPEVKLTIDHVVPEALGGTDEPGNLVAACSDCNSGKSATPPDAARVADVEQDALRWSRAMAQAAENAIADYAARAEVHGDFASEWSSWASGEGASRIAVPLPAGWEESIDRFVSVGMPAELLKTYIPIAMGANHVGLDMRFNYLCGIAWKKVTQLQDEARQLVVGFDPGDEPEGGGWVDQQWQTLSEQYLDLLGAVDKFVWEFSSADRVFEQIRHEKVKSTVPWGPELGREEMLREMMRRLPAAEREVPRRPTEVDV